MSARSAGAVRAGQGRFGGGRRAGNGRHRCRPVAAGRPAHTDALVGMGGAVTNMAAVKHGMAEYDPDVVQGTILDVGELERQITLYRERDADGRRQIPGLQPKRAEVIRPAPSSCVP